MFTSREENTWIDLLISDREFGGRKISLFSGRINGRLVRSLFPARFSGSADIPGIEGVLKTVGEKFVIHFHADKSGMIKVKYDAVKRYDSYCYNTELAASSIEHEGKTYSSDVSFLEHGTADNLQGFREATLNESNGTRRTPLT